MARLIPIRAAILAGSIAVIAAGQTAPQPAGQPANGAFAVSRTIHVGGEGGWDYITIDPEHKMLFVPRTTHTQVLDAENGHVIADIPGQGRNHGVVLVPQAGRGFISDSQDGSLTVFDLKTYKELGRIKVAAGADAVNYDAASRKVLVGCGRAKALVTVSADVDLKDGKADAPIDLGGEPEYMVPDGSGRVFVNLEDKSAVAVVDLKSGKLVATWPLAPGGAPTGLAIDREHGRLFAACREPAKMIVLSTQDGKVLADLPIGAGADGARFDAGYAFASCRDGTLAVIRETGPGKFEVVQTVKTRPGARTLDVDPATHAIYLPTAEYSDEKDDRGRPKAKPDSFMIVVVQAGKA